MALSPEVMKAMQADQAVSDDVKSMMSKDQVSDDDSHDASEYAAPAAPQIGAPQQPQAAKPAAQPPITPQNPQGGAPGLKPPKPRLTLSDPWAQSSIEAAGDAFTDAPAALAENAVSAGTGLASSIVGGLAGAGRALYGMADAIGKGKSAGESFDQGMAEGADLSRGIQEAGTYQPRTEGGQGINQGQQMIMDTANKGNKMIGGAVGSMVGPKSEVAGEAVGENLLPVIGALAGRKGMVDAAKSATKNRLENPIMEPGKDYSPLRDLTPEQRDRYDRQKKLGIEPTLASVTRDAEQFRFEDQAAATKEGANLRSRQNENDDAITKAVGDTDKMRMGRKNTENERETGHSVATAIEAKAKESLDKVDTLYKAARAAGETKEIVDAKPLEKWFKDVKPESVHYTQIQALKAKYAQLKAARKGKLNIDDMDILYRAANDLSTDGSVSKFMGDARRVMDEITDGKGGDLYKQARAARIAHAFEFQDRTAIADLISKKNGSRTDYKTKNEGVFAKTVINSSLVELKDVTQSLLSVDPKTHPEAFQAVRNLQGQTIDYLVSKATMDGETPFNPAKYKAAMRTIGKDKLEHLLGPDALARLDDVMKAAREVKRAPGKSVSGSDTNVNLQMMAERGLRDSAAKHLMKQVPLAKTYFEFTGAKAAKARTTAQVKEALQPRLAPPEVIEKGAAAARKQKRQRLMQESGAMTRGVAPAYPAVVESGDEEQ